MPRGRPRKPRLSRMDAAIDAMAPLGFPGLQVRKAVKQLLKEYGGDEGWPFIEAYSYKELIEAILRDIEQNNQVNDAQDKNLLEMAERPTSTGADKEKGKEKLVLGKRRARSPPPPVLGPDGRVIMPALRIGSSPVAEQARSHTCAGSNCCYSSN